MSKTKVSRVITKYEIVMKRANPVIDGIARFLFIKARLLSIRFSNLYRNQSPKWDDSVPTNYNASVENFRLQNIFYIVFYDSVDNEAGGILRIVIIELSGKDHLQYDMIDKQEI